MSDYLMHYGRKGMKWHKHIFDSGDAKTGDRFEKTKRRYRRIPHADITIGSITYNGQNVQVTVDKNRNVSVSRVSSKKKERISYYEADKRRRESRSEQHRAAEKARRETRSRQHRRIIQNRDKITNRDKMHRSRYR